MADILDDNVDTIETDDLSIIPLDKWVTVDFEKQIVARKGGITKASFYNDVKMWNAIIHSLPEYSDNDIRKEIRGWDLTIPPETFDFETLVRKYSNFVNCNDRLIYIKSLVNAHYETFNKAYKSLRISAMVLFTGTAKDKEASAENLVQPFYIGTVGSQNLLDYLKDIADQIDFAATQMARVLREKEALAKVNTPYNREGMARDFEQKVRETETKEEESLVGKRRIR